MAHYAEIDGNGIVLRVIVVSDEDALDGENFCNNLLGGTWKQTSYNTHGGVYLKSGTPFRKNFAAKGYKYDSTRDAFLSKQHFPSWSLDEDTCRYEPPVPEPKDGKQYTWNETTKTWDLK